MPPEQTSEIEAAPEVVINVETAPEVGEVAHDTPLVVAPEGVAIEELEVAIEETNGQVVEAVALANGALIEAENIAFDFAKFEEENLKWKSEIQILNQMTAEKIDKLAEILAGMMELLAPRQSANPASGEGTPEIVSAENALQNEIVPESPPHLPEEKPAVEVKEKVRQKRNWI